MAIDYCTLTQVRAQLGLTSTETKDDAQLAKAIRGATRIIELNWKRRFDIRREALVFDVPSGQRSSFGVYSGVDYAAGVMPAPDDRTLAVDEDLLAVEQITNGDGSVLDSDDFILHRANKWPKFAIELKASSGVSWTPSGIDRKQVIGVLGYWGWHKQYPDAFQDSLDTVQNAGGMNTSTTLLQVSNASGVAEDLQSPRFQAGQMLKLQSEFVKVISITTNDLTVKRAENGTVAASHALATPISIFRPYDSVNDAAISIVIWAYRRKDVNSFDVQSILGTGVRIIPQAIPADVIKRLPAPRPMSLRG